MDAKLAMGLLIAYLFLTGLVSASSNVSLSSPVNDSSCIPGSHTILTYFLSQQASACDVYTNNSGTWNIAQTIYNPTTSAYNSFNVSLAPKVTLWGVRCLMSGPSAYEYSSNYSFTQANVSYCAVISGVTCPQNVSLGSEEILKFRLGNTNGIWLENQDANVWIENSRGEVVKNFNTLAVMAQTSILLDKDGNWLNTAEKVPLTDSNGYYVYAFKVDPAWAWVGDAYTVKASANGQSAQCTFNVQTSRLPDVNNYSSQFKQGGGFLILISLLIIVLLGIWRYVKRR